MSGGDGLLSYDELIGAVRRLCGQGATGCIFITTSDNHSVRFELRAGAITAISFRHQGGMDAVGSVQRLTAGRLKFSEEAVQRPPQPGLPSTAELLLLLTGGPPEERETSQPPAAAIGDTLARSRAVIEAELAEYLGPLAPIVCGEHIATAPDMNGLLESLGAELRDAAKAARFKQRVRARLTAGPAA